MKEAKDIERAEENLQALQNQRTELQARLEEEIEQITRSKSSEDYLTLQQIAKLLRSNKNQIRNAQL